MSKIAKYLGQSNTAVNERVYAPDHVQNEAAILDFTNIRKVQET